MKHFLLFTISIIAAFVAFLPSVDAANPCREVCSGPKKQACLDSYNSKAATQEIAEKKGGDKWSRLFGPWSQVPNQIQIAISRADGRMSIAMAVDRSGTFVVRFVVDRENYYYWINSQDPSCDGNLLPNFKKLTKVEGIRTAW